ncbi:MAG: CoA transferase [Flavobacteriales bacterium]|nr:CoA transferase [Flavobacteriales bacterium]
MENKTLSSLKVLELASVLAGPSVGMFLAELGAEVTKIENPRTQGDVTRHWKQKSEDPSWDYSAYFASVNWGKKHLFIDLKDEAGAAKVRAMASEADIIISNYRAGQGEHYGLDYESVRKTNPNVIYGHVTGFGEDDGRPAYDVVLQAETGYMFMNGQPESEPTKLPIALIDILCSHQLKEGLLLALFKKERTGKGCKVTASLLDAAVTALSNQATNWLMNGHIPQRTGSLHPNIAPYGEVLTTSDDKHIVLAVGSEQQYRSLCDVLGLEELKEDPRFVDNQIRVENRGELKDFMLKKAALQTADQLMAAFLAHGVPAGIIKNMKEVFEQPKAQASVLEDTMSDGNTAKRVSQMGFHLES